MTSMIESKSRISSLGNILLILLILFLYAHPEPFFCERNKVDSGTIETLSRKLILES